MVRPLVLFLLSFLPFPALADVTVGWISRTPALDYVWGSANPSVDGWPLAGTTVTWRAHVKNWDATPQTIAYAWRIDGVETKRGSVTLAANATTVAELPWLWTFDRHRITFAIDGGSELEVFSDALAVGFWVEQSFYDYFRANQSILGIESNSFEDWAQRTVALWNDMAALAVYDETPHGVLDRMRIEKIVIVPDDALPLNGLPAEATLGAGGATHPDQHDRTVDLMWGFRKEVLTSYLKSAKLDPQNWFYTGVGALHELGHARYLVDVYAWDVRHEPPHFIVDVTHDGQRVIGSQTRLVHRTPEQGLMNKHYSFIDRYSAIAMNFIAGRRATFGNYNEPRNFASFLNDFPAQNRILIRDANGTRMTNADVYVYQAEATLPTERWYGARFDDTPDLILKTDANGHVLVGRSPFGNGGTVVHAPHFANGVAIVKVVKDGVWAHGYLESRLFNLEYWRGHTAFADHELIVGLECTADGPRLYSPTWDEQTNGAVTLSWEPSISATRYRVYASSNLGAPQLIATTTGSDVTVHLDGRVYWWVESDLGLCGRRRSLPGRFEASNPTYVRRRASRK